MACEDIVGFGVTLELEACEEVEEPFALDEEVVGFGGAEEELETDACEEVVGFGGTIVEEEELLTAEDDVVGLGGTDSEVEPL